MSGSEMEGCKKNLCWDLCGVEMWSIQVQNGIPVRRSPIPTWFAFPCDSLSVGLVHVYWAPEHRLRERSSVSFSG